MNLQEVSSTKPSWMMKTSGYATTRRQDYKVTLCSLLLLRALRFKADFFLGTNVALADKFNVVLFYRLEEDVGLKYRAILLQAKHKDKYKDQDLSSSYPFKFNDYLESFNMLKNLWEQSVTVENREIELQEIALVLYTNTECVVGDAALDVTDCPKMQHLQDFLNTEGKLFRISEAQRVGLPEGQETSEFLGHLLLCTQQMSVKTADHILEEEIYKTLNLTSIEDARNLNSVLKRVMKDWWSEKETVRYLTTQSEEWIKVLQTQVTHFNSDTLIVDRELNLNYTEYSLQEFDVDPRLSKMTWISVKDKYQAKSVRSRFFRAKRNSVVVGVKNLESHFEEVDALWGKTVCPTLALEMSECSQEEGSLLLQRMKEAVQKDACKVLFVINKEKPPTDGWNVVEAVATWSVLDQTTRERLLKVQVELQGKLVALQDVVGLDVSDVMSEEIIYSLSVSKNAIKLGEPTPSRLEFYVPRCLKRIISNVIDLNSLIKKNTLLFAKTGIFEPWFLIKYLSESDLIRVDKIEGPICVRGINSESVIRNLCNRYRVRGLFGNLHSICSEYVLTEIFPFTWICEEKIVVIEGVPGVGKSSFVSAMCSSVKQQFPEAWVLRIDMGRHSDYIKERDFTSSSDIKEFLLKGFLKDLNKLEKDLLEHSLYLTRNVYLFLDAFDEISPYYTAKCCQLLKGIVQNFRFRQMVVTTRPVTTKDVQKALETEAFTLPVFSEEEQTSFLERFFVASRKNVDKEEISSLRESAGPVLEIPLLCRMASEVLLYQQDQILLKCANPWRKVLLYKLFVEQIVMNRLSEKCGLDAAIPEVKKLLESNQKQHLQNLQGLAVSKLMPVFSSFVSSETPEEMLGLVVNTLETVDFEHQTFAEYFFGCWLASNWHQCSQEVLHKLVFQYGFLLIAPTFTWSLFEDLPLHMAVAQGDEVAVWEHLSSWTTDGGGRSALHVAAMTKGKHRGVWELLVSNGDALNRKDDILNSTAVMYAEMSENWDFIDFMLVKGVSLKDLKFVRDENTAKKILLYVTKIDLTNLCQCILRLHKGIFNDSQSNIYLCKAAAKNSTGVLKVLIEMGYDLNLMNSNERTPLHQASSHGHMEAVRMLIENGADLNFKAGNGETALMMASNKGHLEVVKLLIENGADLNSQSIFGRTALMTASKNGHLEVVKLLIENGTELNSQSRFGKTALMKASNNGHLEVVKLLIEGGADLNSQSRSGETALMTAALRGHLEVVKLLIEGGADLNSQGMCGETALKWEILKGPLEMVKLLIENGADLNSQSRCGETALMTAAFRGHLEVVKLLIENGTDLNFKTVYGCTALMNAVREGHLDVVKLLIEGGADPNIKTDKGETALMEAARRDHVMTVEYLLTNGADPNISNAEGETAFEICSEEVLTIMSKHAVYFPVDYNGE